MMKNYVAILVSMMLIMVVGCKNKPATEASEVLPVLGKANPIEKIEDPEQYCYQLDSIIFSEKIPTASDRNEIWFVQKFNTPGFFAKSNISLGELLDVLPFFGHDGGDGFVYFVDEYHAFSPKRIAETGDSVTLVEEKIPKNGLVHDVRLTAWWLYTIQDYHFTNDLDHDLRGLTGICDRAGFETYLDSLKKEILACAGESIREKIISFTQQMVKGDPNSWSAATFPGYY